MTEADVERTFVAICARARAGDQRGVEAWHRHAVDYSAAKSFQQAQARDLQAARRPADQAGLRRLEQRNRQQRGFGGARQDG